ncbi:arginase [Alkalibacillus haloalkaliphilus]|uniref:arginase n=1 Tax=Alkalibacillus haloalkaliphilus TaxID=94136 RepID=UPI0029367503|nr:arginase [Alkalibacillus haloalkaliphilus]MDV2581889.1 arginase [Alkalibacillus haloalkaliphilus]
MKNRVGIIGAPITIAQPNYGVDLGPNAIRYAGLHKRLDGLNVKYEDYGNIDIKNEGSNEKDPKTNLKNLKEVTKGNQTIADELKKLKSKGDFPLILGGDHSIAIGTIAGLYSYYQELGVIWFDAHADLNSGETSPSGNIHGMSLAASLGVGHQDLTSINGDGPKVKPENTVIIGARSIDEGERKFIKEHGVQVYTMHDIEKRGMDVVIKEAIGYLRSRVNGVHLSLDVDGIDPLHTPGTGTPVDGGPSYRETFHAMSTLYDSEILTSVEIVEVNPLLDQRNQTAEVATDMIAAVFGEKYI